MTVLHCQDGGFKCAIIFINIMRETVTHNRNSDLQVETGPKNSKHFQGFYSCSSSAFQVNICCFDLFKYLYITAGTNIFALYWEMCNYYSIQYVSKYVFRLSTCILCYHDYVIFVLQCPCVLWNMKEKLYHSEMAVKHVLVL